MSGSLLFARILAASVAAGGWLAQPGAALAAPPAAATPSNDALAAERTRLRTELDRVNAEIDTLKRTGGVGDDYRLRARLADAEGLARRLIEIESRLGIRAGAPAAAKPLAPPTAARTDGPADLDAKADILADQSRHLRAEADALGARAKEIKRRQDLRRRSAELDRDPFAAMEGSKRRVASATGQGFVPGADSAKASLSPPIANPGLTTSSGSGGPIQTATNSSGASQQPMGAGTFSGSTHNDAATPLTTASAPAEGGLAVQLRDMLDTATLADIRRLEVRSPGGSTQALDRAAVALRARAADLDARARTMRAQAHPTARPPAAPAPR
jgi:hypothetical protein